MKSLKIKTKLSRISKKKHFIRDFNTNFNFVFPFLVSRIENLDIKNVSSKFVKNSNIEL